MSAFVVSRHHIDAMVTAAIACGHKYGGTAFRWQYEGADYELDSAAEVSETVTRTNLLGREYDVHVCTPSVIGAVLLAENERSVDKRYDGNGYGAASSGYEYRENHQNVLQAIKACHCWQYQTCETSDYTDTLAWAFVSALAESLARNLPGYDDAAWEISEPSNVVRIA